MKPRGDGSPDHLDHGQHADKHVDFGELEDLNAATALQ
jgi:hypothetical protein